MTKPPQPLTSNQRSSTIEELGRALGVDDMGATRTLSSSSNISRPPALRTEGRLSTAEYLDIVNEPIGMDEADARNTKPIDLAALDEEAKGVGAWLKQV